MIGPRAKTYRNMQLNRLAARIARPFRQWLNRTNASLGPAKASFGPATAATFLDAYGDRGLTDLLSDWQEQDVDPQLDAWAQLPPRDFLDFCRTYPRTPFDGIPPSASYLKSPTYLISQAHRLWVTTSLAHERLTALNASHLLDVGSFPFFACLVLRDFFGFKGAITATTNLALDSAGASFLAAKDIQVQLLDLDPYVQDPTHTTRLPRSLDCNASSFDFVLCSHVIEHLYHPISILTECSRLVRPGGELMVTTDNAMMIDVLMNYVTAQGYTFEPVENTAAMHFNFWRGHVRFFTDQDLKTMLRKSGFDVIETKYFQCFYDVFFEEFFKVPKPKLQAFKRRMLAEAPWLRNDIAVIGRKATSLPA